MKYYNKVNMIVMVGPRESVQPFGVTRDFTEDEAEKIVELRYAIKDRGYLIPWDGESELPRHTREAPPVAKYQMQPGKNSGTLVKKESNGRVVEYIVADTKGTDHVENAASNPDVISSLPPENRPTEFIEEAVSARDNKGQMKTKWVNAADALAAQLKRESDSADSEFNDDANLTESDDRTRSKVLDADAEIRSDYTQVLRKNGTMGASLVTTKELVEEASLKATSTLAEAVKPNVDDGELVDGASKDVAEFLKKNFFGKKWFIAKSSDTKFLSSVLAATQSENLKSLITQRLAELEKSAKKV